MIRILLGLFLILGAAGTCDTTPLNPLGITLALGGFLLLASGRHAFKDLA